MEEIPKINVGRYKGTPIDQLPTSYLRWMLNQGFPKEWLEIAKRKVEQSPHSNEPMSLSRHAIDQFSLRFILRWQKYNVERIVFGKKEEGLGTFLVKLAEHAWLSGVNISKNRHQDDGIVIEHNGIKFVFDQSKHFPEYKELITVME